jgi:predicted acetyltransferase
MRSEWQWKRVLGENRQLTIYAVGEPVEAYAVVSHVTAFWTVDHISEVIWSSRRGYEGLLSMLGGLAINKTALTWFEPSDGPLYSDYLDQGVTASLERPIMFRVTDVKSALEALKPASHMSGRFSLQVYDNVIAANESQFQIEYSSGKVQVSASADGNADVSLDIRNFAQAFLGEPGLQNLVRLERVEVGDEERLADACALMPSQSVYCTDFF